MVREFSSNELAPLADEVDTSEEFPRRQWDGLRELGLCGLLISDRYGGAGMGYREFAIVLEEVGAACGSTSTVLITHTSLGSETLNRFGSSEQHDRWLPGLADGSRIAAFALTEAGTGSDALALQTTIRDSGDCYVLNGSKLFITNGEVADLFAVFATSDRSAGYKGVSAVVVERGTPGLEINGQHGKMGMRGSATTIFPAPAGAGSTAAGRARGPETGGGLRHPERTRSDAQTAAVAAMAGVFMRRPPWRRGVRNAPRKDGFRGVRPAFGRCGQGFARRRARRRA